MKAVTLPAGMWRRIGQQLVEGDDPFRDKDALAVKIDQHVTIYPDHHEIPIGLSLWEWRAVGRCLAHFQGRGR